MKWRIPALNVNTVIAILLCSIIKTCNSQSFSKNGQISCTSLNEDGKTYLLDGDSHKCYEVGTRASCNEMMIFYKNPSTSKRLSNYGFCDCDQGYKSDFPCTDNPTRRKVYSHKHKRCFSVFSQGPCEKGHYLTLNENDGSANCALNPCLKYTSSPSSNQFWFYHPKRKRCYQSLTQGYCPPNFQLEIVHDSQYPQCRQKSCYSSISHGIRSALTCKPGSRIGYLTRTCTKTFKNLFGLG